MQVPDFPKDQIKERPQEENIYFFYYQSYIY